MKLIILLDQIQAGLGGKEKADTPLGGKRLAMGAADTLDKRLTAQDTIIGTFYCGTDYYQEHQSEVQRKVAKMSEKMGADVVLAGPTYDYPEFSQMACELAIALQEQTEIPVIVGTAIEKNEGLIETYKNQLTLVKMPKKGGTGLSDAIDAMLKGCQLKVAQADMTQFKQTYCY